MAANFNSRRGVLSEINVTPLVDVVLVLLVIFMITAPLLHTGLDVEVPKVPRAGQKVESADPLKITIDKNRRVFLEKKQITLDRLDGTIKMALKNRSQKNIYLIVDQSVDYGFFAKILSIAKASGASQILLVTELQHQP